MPTTSNSTQKNSLSTTIIVYANGLISIWFLLASIYTFFLHPKSILSDLAYKTEPVAAFNFIMLQWLEYKALAIFFLLLSIYYMIITTFSTIMWSIGPITRKTLEWMWYKEIEDKTINEDWKPTIINETEVDVNKK